MITLYKILNRLTILVDKLISQISKYRFKTCGHGFYLKGPSNVLGGEFIHIGNNFSCFSRLRLEAYSRYGEQKFSPKIFIGNNVSLNFDCHIACIDQIVIEDNVLVASKVYISDHSHGQNLYEEASIPPGKRKLYSKGPVIIRDSVWIGEGACILPGVEIGRCSIIGANSVVTRSIPPNSIVGGVPAKVLKSFTDI